MARMTLSRKQPRALYLEPLYKLTELVLESDYRDQAPSPGDLKVISCQYRNKERKHENVMMSLQLTMEEKAGTDHDVLQKII